MLESTLEVELFEESLLFVPHSDDINAVDDFCGLRITNFVLSEYTNLYVNFDFGTFGRTKYKISFSLISFSFAGERTHNFEICD